MEQDIEALRDFFAGAALAGKLANPAFVVDIEIYKSIPRRCYELADAMIAARQQGN